jgi:predicted RNase H-like nuclease (RuvC/YqgF family)
MSKRNPNWGGARTGAGNKPKWKCGKTTAIRVPEILSEQILALARTWDEEQPERVIASPAVEKDEYVQYLQETVQLQQTELKELRNSCSKIAARAAEQESSVNRLTQTNIMLNKERDLVRRLEAELILKNQKATQQQQSIDFLRRRRSEMYQKLMHSQEMMKNGNPIIPKLQEILTAASDSEINSANYSIYIQIAQACINGTIYPKIDRALQQIAQANTSDKTANKHYRRQALSAL